MAIALCCPVMVCDRHSLGAAHFALWCLFLGASVLVFLLEFHLCAVKTAKANYLLMLGIFIYVLKTAKASYFYCPLSVFCVKYAQLCLIVCFCGLMKLLTAIQEQFEPKWIKMRFRGSCALRNYRPQRTWSTNSLHYGTSIVWSTNFEAWPA